MTHTTRGRLLVDTAMALALGALAVLITAHFIEASSPDDATVDAYALILVGLAFAPLAIRRRWPLVALGIITAAATIYLLEGFPYGPILLGFFIAVYTVASRLPLRTAGISTGVAMVVLLTHVWIHPSALGGALGIIPGSAWAVVPFAIGAVVRTTRQAGEAARAEAVRQQTYDERMRLAQEVHDIVGHGLAAIQMQADVALHVDEQQTPRTRTALESISRASAEAFEELRSTLDLMSGPRGVTRPSGTPGLDDIDGLCERIRASGVEVALARHGQERPVSPAVGLAAYRVLQESLTNVMRHGEVPAADVTIEFGEDTLRLRIANRGTSSPDVVSGHGIDGMRNRVASVAGTIDAGPKADGFVVDVRLPLGASG